MKIVEFLSQTVAGKLSLDEQKKYLLANPFPSAQEIAEAVEYLYGQMPEVPNLPEAIDICGTGGSGLSRPNISTISAFIVAGAGIKVAKHGNNAASGRFGSFDLLNALDIPINLSLLELQARYNEYNLAFLYARNFHPAMRFFAPVRAELSQPTFFNILGPLLSPVKAKKQLIGTSEVKNARTIAEVSRLLGKQRVIVVSGSDGLDEVTLTGPTHIVELKDGQIKEYDITPADFGVVAVNDFLEIEVKNPKDNTKIAEAVLSGTENTKITDLVLVNSAMALYLAGKSDDLQECYEVAKKTIDSGMAKQTMENYRLPSVLSKIVARDAARNLRVDSDLSSSGKKYSGGLIAEIKKKSPSEGDINNQMDIVKQAKLYEAAGASAISVLTEPADFNGSFEDLKTISQAVSLPVLCKDFIVRKEHIDKARSCGADMILLIAAVLDKDKIKELYDYAADLGLQSVVEVHSPKELEKVLPFKPEIIGVNSRNLHDFSLQPGLFEELFADIPSGVIKIAESGINHYKDVPAKYDGILVGTALMNHPFPALKIKELLGLPLLKLCGIREVRDAELCESLGVDMIGINFVPRSRRRVDIEQAKQIVKACSNTIPVGIFEDQDPDEVNKIASEAGVSAVQLSGSEKDLNRYELPIIKTIRSGEQRPPEAFLTIIDSAVAGSGEKIDHDKLQLFEPSLIAGGVDLTIAKELLKNKKPLGIDTASGIETDGNDDPDKIKALQELIAKTRYA